MTKEAKLNFLIEYYEAALLDICTMTARRDGSYKALVEELSLTFAELLGLES